MKSGKKLLVIKILVFVFAFAVAFLPSTASRNREVNSRVIVEMLGVDGADDGVELTAQYVMPTADKGGTSKDCVSVTGKTVTEAVDEISRALGRRAELGHCSLVIVGDEASPELFDTLLTATDVTADTYVFAAEKDAKSLAEDLTEFMKKTGATDADFIAYSAKKAHVATKTLLAFLSDLGSYSDTGYMPIIEMQKTEESGGSGGQSGSGGESGSGGSGGGSSGSSAGGESTEGGGDKFDGMKTEKLALYCRDGRKGVLDRCCARGVAWLGANVEKSVLVADVEHGDGKIENVSATMLKKCSQIKLRPGGATVKLKVTVEPNGDRFNRTEREYGMASEAVKEGFKKKIEKEVKDAFDAATALGSDPFFITRELYRFAPDKAVKSVDELDVDFDVSVVLK